MEQSTIRVAELFAGVGGFRLGLEGYHNPEHPEFDMPAAGPFRTVWADNWEPDGRASKQFAWRCYEHRFGVGSCVNEDIAVVVDQIRNGERELPEFDMLVGGFPCQDYSVAKPAGMASGIDGKKGVLWWSINSILEMRHPKRVLLENVDRLLKSPTAQRGRDFAIILSCLTRLGYSVEWRVINAADYGMPQRRRRVYIYAEHAADGWNPRERLERSGIMAEAFPCTPLGEGLRVRVGSDPYEATQHFGVGDKTGVWANAGVMQYGVAYTVRTKAVYAGPETTLGGMLVSADQVPDRYWIDDAKLPAWQYLKGAKKERRIAANGFEYTYSEGPVAFPDPLDRPSRTILTGEGGARRIPHEACGPTGWTVPEARARRAGPIADVSERLDGGRHDGRASRILHGQRAGHRYSSPYRTGHRKPVRNEVATCDAMASASGVIRWCLKEFSFGYT